MSARLLLLAALFCCARSGFPASLLRGLYTRSVGRSVCPRLIQIESRDLSLAPFNISLNNRSCTSGSLSLVSIPPSPSSASNPLSVNLLEIPSLRPFILGVVQSRLICPDRHLNPPSYFVFLRSSSPLTLSWRGLYSRGDTLLANLTGSDTFTVRADRGYLLLNDECVYTRLDIPDSAAAPACFPASARVTVGSGARVRMDALRVGDVVRAGAEGGTSRVVLFTHRAARWMRVVRIRVANRTLVASHGHLLPAEGDVWTAMRDVRVGARVRVHGRGWREVERVDVGWAWGMWNPQTESGSIVVNGVHVSCYTDAVGQAAGHAYMAPVRAAAKIARAWAGKT